MGFAVACAPAAFAGCLSFASLGVMEQISSPEFKGRLDVRNLSHWILMGTITGIALAAIHSVAGVCASLLGGGVLILFSLFDCSAITGPKRRDYLDNPYITIIALTILGTSCGYTIGSM